MDVIFCAELNEIKTVHNVLRAISFTEFATLRIMEEGLKVTIEDMKTIQTSAYIPNDVFTRYVVKLVDENDPIKFKISLKIFTECLNIFGDDGRTSLKLIYKQSGGSLYLLLTHSDENITVDCEIRTMEAEDVAELSLSDECTLNNVVINAVPLVNLLTELDSTSDVLKLLISPSSPYLQISTVGTMGESQIDVNKNSEIIVIFRCEQISESTYKFNSIRMLLKVMALANKVSISTGDNGLLGLQLIINTESEKRMFVEYYLTALLDDD